MKVIFIYPDLLGYYYSGIGILTAVLKKAGHDAALLHLTQPIARKAFLKRLRPLFPPQGPRLIAFSLTSNQYPFLCTWGAGSRTSGRTR